MYAEEKQYHPRLKELCSIISDEKAETYIEGLDRGFDSLYLEKAFKFGIDLFLLSENEEEVRNYLTANKIPADEYFGYKENKFLKFGDIASIYQECISNARKYHNIMSLLEEADKIDNMSREEWDKYREGKRISQEYTSLYNREKASGMISDIRRGLYNRLFSRDRKLVDIIDIILKMPGINDGSIIISNEELNEKTDSFFKEYDSNHDIEGQR